MAMLIKTDEKKKTDQKLMQSAQYSAYHLAPIIKVAIFIH